VTDASGKSIFDGRDATGFSDAEEEQVGKVKDVPFLLETRIKELGGKYTKASEAWAVSTYSERPRILGIDSYPHSPRLLSTDMSLLGRTQLAPKV
jgi:hypothetical protein